MDEVREIDRFIHGIMEADVRVNGGIASPDDYVRGALAVLAALGFDEDMDIKVGGTDE